MVYSERDSIQKDTSSSAVTSSLSDLIARLEKATGPDRELDGKILMASNADVVATYRGMPDYATEITHSHSSTSVRTIDVPFFTSSIDAAMTLLLPWMSVELTQSAAGPFTRARVWDWRRSPTMADPGNEWKSEGDRPLPINIAATALKARCLPAI